MAYDLLERRELREARRPPMAPRPAAPRPAPAVVSAAEVQAHLESVFLKMPGARRWQK
jgi:hypothetical protein